VNFDYDFEKRAYEFARDCARQGQTELTGEGQNPGIGDLMDAAYDYSNGDPSYGEIALIEAAWDAGVQDVLDQDVERTA
jgi:hypothetical protein